MPEQDNQNLVIQVTFNIAEYKQMVGGELYDLLRLLLLDDLPNHRNVINSLTFKVLKSLDFTKNNALHPKFIKFMYECLGDEALEKLNFHDTNVYTPILETLAEEILQMFADRYKNEPAHLCSLA